MADNKWGDYWYLKRVVFVPPSTIFHLYPWAKCDFWTKLLTKAFLVGLLVASTAVMLIGGGVLVGAVLYALWLLQK